MQRDFRDLPQRHAAPARGGKQDVANGLRREAKFGLIANHEIEAPIAFEDLRRGDACDGRLHGAVYIRSHQSVARARRAIDGDQQFGLARLLKHG